MATMLVIVTRLTKLTFYLLTAIYCLTSYADEKIADDFNTIGYRCTMGENIRRVEINYPQSPETLPCEVIYHKDTEEPNNPEVLWRAENDASYCEMKADIMVYRLTTEWGWQCH